jgi:hypothetical protein
MDQAKRDQFWADFTMLLDEMEKRAIEALADGYFAVPLLRGALDLLRVRCEELLASALDSVPA